MFRHCAILVLALMLASCSISRDYTSPNRVTLEFRDSGLKDCYLLAVQDDALLVSDIDPAGLRSEELDMHTMILPSRAVEKIYQKREQTFTGTLIPKLADIFSARRSFSVNAFGGNLSALYDATRFTINYFTSKPWSEFVLTNERDVELLESNVAQFPSYGSQPTPVR